MERGRAIGPLGTLARVAVGLGLGTWAVVGNGVGWREVALGLAGFPAAVLLAQWGRRRFDRSSLRATGHLGFCLNAAVVALLLVPSATRGATLLWLGAAMLVAAWRGYAGCESLAISNWLLRRDDQVGCVESAKVRAWLRDQGVAFIERDASSDPVAARALCATGTFATPLLVVRTEKVLGFRPESLAALVKGG